MDVAMEVDVVSKTEGASTDDSADESGDHLSKVMGSCGDQLLPLSADDERSNNRLEKELRQLTFANPGRRLAEMPPIAKRTRRVVRPMNYGGNVEGAVYDYQGLYKDKYDFCDCLTPECPGCHFPCPKCGSRKCGAQCRCNRRYTYTRVVLQGKKTKLKNPYVDQQPQPGTGEKNRKGGENKK